VENDSIRSSGTNTIVDVWVDGRVRSICITRAAIGAYLGFDEAQTLSEDERCEFVRNNLSLLMTAARNRLRELGAGADSVVIDTGDLPRSDGRSGDRRATDRRKAERRQVKQPREPKLERRKSDKRQGERRAPPPKRS
jgi:hypothetical protein